MLNKWSSEIHTTINKIFEIACDHGSNKVVVPEGVARMLQIKLKVRI